MMRNGHENETLFPVDSPHDANAVCRPAGVQQTADKNKKKPGLGQLAVTDHVLVLAGKVVTRDELPQATRHGG